MFLTGEKDYDWIWQTGWIAEICRISLFYTARLVATLAKERKIINISYVFGGGIFRQQYPEALLDLVTDG